MPGPDRQRTCGDDGVSVLVDARALRTSGLGRYLRSILSGLLRDRRFGSFRLVGNVREIEEFADTENAGTRVSSVAFRPDFYSGRAQLDWQALRLKGLLEAGVAFMPHYDVPLLFLPRRSVVTVHDLIHFEVPEVFSGWRRHAAGLLLRRAVEQASRIIAVSESTGRDVVRRHPAVAKKVAVVPNGVDAFFEPTGTAEERRDVLGGPFLLCVGNRKPHKNHVAAVEVLARVRRTVPDLRLVIAGASFGEADNVLERAEQLGIRDAVIERERVSEEELRGLYQSCEALVFPSLYEGFGLPLLEAMACGAPVVASNRSSIPEVAGNAALLADPHDHDRMAEQVLLLIGDSGIRKEMRERGLVRSAEYRWDRAVSRTADLLYAVAAYRPSGGKAL